MNDDTLNQFESLWKTVASGHGTVPVDATIRADVRNNRLDTMPAALPRIVLGSGEGTASADLIPSDKLGEGGMGQVLLARQQSLGRDVAVKRLRTEVSSAEMFAALLHEARVTGGLEHPNIVPVHALGVGVDGNPLMVMKRVEGVSWRTLVYEAENAAWQRLPVRHEDPLVTHVELLVQVCNALQFAHARGVIHRDLKLENVMVGEFGEVYVLDWGIALRVPAPEREPGARPRLLGTPSYMAPEMVAGYDDAMDARTDVYLVGAMLHEILTRTPRHAGQTLHEVLLKAFLSEPPTYGSDVPPELAELCLASTQKDPAKRPADVAAFRRGLADYLRHRTSRTLSDSAMRSLDQLTTSSASLVTHEAWGHLTEARFGFLQALREWSGNEAARKGLQTAVEQMIEREIAQKNPTAARGLLRELPSERKDLEARIDALAAEVDEAQRKSRHLDELRKEMDISVSSGARQAFLGALSVLGLVTLALVVSQPKVDASLPLDVISLCVNATGWTVFGGVGWLFRRKFFANTVNRRLSILFFAMGVFFIAMEGIAILSKAHPDHTDVYAIATLSAMFAAAAIVFAPSFWLQAGIALAGAVLSPLRPNESTLIDAITKFALIATIAWQSRTGRMRPHAGDVIGK